MSLDQNTEEPAWFALKSQTKREHIAARILSEVEGVQVFCPRIRFKKATRRGTIWWVEPLFPGYLFAHFHYTELYRQVTASHGVSGIVHFGGKIPSLPEEVIGQVRELIREQSEDDIIEFKPRVEPGDDVEIATGAFKGVTGVVLEPLPAQERVRILIELLGQDQVVELDLYSLLLPKRPIPK